MILTLFVGCGEESVSVDISAFNKIIESKKDIKSPKELIVIYLNNIYPEIDADVIIKEEKLKEDRYLITLVLDNLKGDSMKSEKFEMVAKFDGEKWKVLTIEKNWRCYPDRGNTEWGIERCN